MLLLYREVRLADTGYLHACMNPDTGRLHVEIYMHLGADNHEAERIAEPESTRRRMTSCIPI